MSAWGGEFKAAYAGFGKWIGIGVAGLAVFSWATHALSLTLAEFLGQVVSAYRSLLHPIIDFLFGWLPFRLPPWSKDIAIFYFVTGGAVARTLHVLYEHHDPAKGDVFGPPIFGRFSRKPTQLLATILTVPLWPLALLSILSAPYVMRNENNNNLFSGNRANYENWRNTRKSARFLFNLRWVFLLQLVAVFVITALIVVLNMAGLGHLRVS